LREAENDDKDALQVRSITNF